MSLSKRPYRFSLLLIIAMLVSIAMYAQNTVSGELTGVVNDPSGAVLPSVTVTLKSQDTGQTQTTKTSNAGFFRFAFLRPGRYNLSAAPAGFSQVNSTAVVSLGQVTNVSLTAAVAGQSTTVEVSAGAPLLQTENGNVTANFSQEQLAALPAPGNDMTNYALTAPGITLSTGAGYGNFSAYGMPGTSNLFTVNGSDNNDPFNGLNNSGASNNSLGTNELQEMTIVTNGYTAQYGRAAGANINYSTKSGTNQFHGNAEWEWNGRSMNANDWFNNHGGAARPFANSNMWMGSIGGPIKKDKLFFFFDSEGMRYVLPGSGPVYVPSPQFEAATLANIPASETPFYTNMFSLFNNSINHQLATPVTQAQDPYDPVNGAGLGCGGVAGTPTTGGTFGLTVPCALTYQGGGSSKNTERLMALKIDLIATQSDKLSFRYWQDRGMQATYSDPINAIFNASSNQPQDQGQMTYTKVISSRAVNQFIAAGSYYSAIFSATNLAGARAAFPTTLIALDGLFASGTAGTALGGEDYAWPQGRRVAQFQFVDDFSWTKGNHNLKFGANIRRNMITDLTPFRNTTGELELTMQSLYGGLALADGSQLIQRYDTHTEAGFSLYSLGLYAQDEWRATSKLKLTLSLRADRNSNTSCKDNCFTRFAGPFVPQAASVPYNQSLLSNLSGGFPKVEGMVWEPRFGFAYSPWGDKTVFRGGIGLFSDLYPAQLAEAFASNPPYTTTFHVAGNNTLIDPSLAGSLAKTGAAGATALLNGYTAGQTVGQISTAFTEATGLNFPLPTVNAAPSTFKNPKYLQWNFEIEQALGPKTALTLNYVGNHGYDEIMQNPWVNSYCNTEGCMGYSSLLPSAAPDSRFGFVNQYTNSGISNYNGLSASLSRRMSYGFSGSLNYTWSHSLDYVSNGDVDPYTLYYGSSSATSILTQIDPKNPARNYGNSDYDFRHNLSANYVWQEPYKSSNSAINAIAGGWSVSGTFFARSGMGYTPYYGSFSDVPNAPPDFGNATPNSDAGNIVLGNFVTGSTACSGPSPAAGATSSCLTKSQFTAQGSLTGLGNYSRNTFRGPMYFDTDMSIAKKFKLRERAALSLGANFYNILNHPNFLPPNPNLSSGSFGQLQLTATPPSSPYGNFQGAAVSGRIIQTMAKFEF